MAPLPFNMLGYIYESGLDSLRASFVSGSQGLRQKLEDTTKALDDYQHSLRNGGEWIGERDPEEGYVIWDQEQVFNFDIDAAHEAYGELRKAFAIAAYHYWERSIRKYCKAQGGKHADLVTKALGEGFPISSDLNRTHRLANALKHNNDSSGKKLLDCWPEVFSSTFKQRKHMDWYSVVHLSDDQVHQAFDIILSSGPQRKLSGT